MRRGTGLIGSSDSLPTDDCLASFSDASEGSGSVSRMMSSLATGCLAGAFFTATILAYFKPLIFSLGLRGVFGKSVLSLSCGGLSRLISVGIADSSGCVSLGLDGDSLPLL